MLCERFVGNVFCCFFLLNGTKMFVDYDLYHCFLYMDIFT